MSTSNFSEVERILERLRLQVSAVQPTQGSPTVVPPAPAPIAELPRKEFVAHDLTSLRTETEIASSGHREFGQINPRPPGIINGFVQLTKKIVRRSLTWYTRPQHVFQGGVIRALQQISAIFDTQDRTLEGLSLHTNHVSAVVDALQQNAAEQAVLQKSLLQMVEATHAHMKQFAVDLSQQRAAIEGQLARDPGAVRRELSPLRQEFTQQLNRGIDPLRQELQGLRAQFTAEKAELLDVIQRQRSRERDIRRLIYALETTSGKTAEELERKPTDEARSSKETEFDYFVFEDRYRGNEDLIRQRQLDYLPYYQGRSNVVDIGCGRGEFLELLRDNGITARGVELGLDQYLLCREKGLDVVQQDLFSFLESLPDESLGGLFSAQVIEHLSAKDQLRYVALAYQKTSPGSPIIFETINALCLFAVLNNYLLDPTHVRLVHPQMLKFAMESMKFRDVELKFMSPVEDRKLPPVKLYQHPLEQDRFNVALDQLNDLIYGNQDFAAIGWH